MEIIAGLLIIGAFVIWARKRRRRAVWENAANITVGIAQNALQDALIKRGFRGAELTTLVRMEGPILAAGAEAELRKSGDLNVSFLQQYRAILPGLAEKHADYCLEQYAKKTAASS